jgi:hypothetical protein
MYIAPFVFNSVLYIVLVQSRSTALLQQHGMISSAIKIDPLLEYWLFLLIGG